MSRREVDAANVLRDSLNRLRSHGWTQGEVTSRTGECCIMGAITYDYDASLWVTIDPDTGGAIDATAKALREMHGLVLSPGEYAGRLIASFNDTPGRTFAEVEAVLERAIEIAEQNVQKIAC